MSASRSLTSSSLLVAALVSTPAFAGGESGFYLGAGVGESYVDVDGFLGVDGEDSGWKLIGGYTDGTTQLLGAALELAYVDFGKPEDGGAEVDASSLRTSRQAPTREPQQAAVAGVELRWHQG